MKQLSLVMDVTLDKNDGVYKILAPTCDLEHRPKTYTRSFKGAVYLVGTCFYSGAVSMWERAGYELVEDIELADIICWLGGADISPKLYGEKKCGAHYFDDRLDQRDLEALEKAGDRFKVGICRGAQLLNCIPNGGSLWQDTDSHGGGHHKVTDVTTGKEYLVNSIHHQQLRLTNKAELIAWTNVSQKKECEKFTWYKGQNSVIEEEPLADRDVEAAWYPETKSLLVQWHPEVGGRDSTDYFMNLMERYYLAA